MQTNNRIIIYRNWAIIATLLWFLTAGFFLVSWNKGRAAQEQVMSQEQFISSLEKEKSRLNAELDSLSASYTHTRAENDSLHGAVAKSERIVQEKLALIHQLRKQHTRNTQDLQHQVAQMQQAKTELETVLALLRAENEQLRAENTRLTGENEQLKGDKEQLTSQVDDLTEKLADQIRQTQSAKFKATSFKVEVEKRGDKQTTRAKRVREIMVSFDLADVPVPYRGVQTLYLVISNDKGIPLSSINPIKVTIDAPGGTIPIIAQQSKNVNIVQTQRLVFHHKLDERLTKGQYLASIYCNSGLLGVSGFRLS